MRSALALLVAATAASAAPKELSLADLAWPASTRSLAAKAEVEIVRAPGSRDAIGKLAAGSRVAWKRIVAGGGACKAYVELAPAGYACANQLAPRDEPPAPALDAAGVVQATLARNYLGTGEAGATAYAAPGAARGKKLESWRFIQDAIYGVKVVNGYVFVKTADGWIDTARLEARPPSRFEGVAVDPKRWPFAWTADDKVTVRAAASPMGAYVRELDRRSRVPVLEQRDGYVRVADTEWIAAADLRIAQSSPRPKGVGAAERWIDVDLDQQVLVAYDGDAPVFATLVSTGLGGSTPTSLHRIREKRMLVHLTAPKISYGTWDMPETPFYMDFRIYYALHGAYWHDMFGKRRSHGCVNLSPRDAGWLFDWTLPAVPAGWQDVTATDDKGTPVRIRDRAHPDPPWTDYMAPPPVPVRPE